MKIKICTFLLIISGLIWSGTISGQTIYFNETIDLASEWGLGMTVLADDSVFNIAAISSLPKKITMVELSQSGEVNWIKKFGNPEENWYPGNPGSLCPSPFVGYVLAGTIEAPDTNYGLLLRFNHQFDTLFSKKYVSNYNYSLILTCAKPTLDSGLIFTGDDYIGGSSSDFILLKTDRFGNEIWRTRKSLGTADRGWSIIQTPDSGYVIGGYHYNPGVYHSGDPLIVKFDKNGTFLWSRNPGGPYQDDKAMVCLNTDSTFTILTEIADSILTNDISYSRICMIKYAQDGSEVWRKKYGSSMAGNYINNIRSLPDGGYICCGSYHEPGNNDIYFFGWLLRVNTNGDSLWFRQCYYSDIIIPYYFNSILDVSQAPDKGFIATGEVWDIYPNGLQKIWVLKVDSLGCEFAGCDSTVSVDEQGGGEAGKRGGLEIWPNPASGIVDCRWSMVDFRGDCLLVIYDMYGREMKKFTLPENERAIQLDVGKLSQGIYLVVVRNESNIIGSSKLVISR